MENNNESTETHWEKAANTQMGRYLTKIETDFVLKCVDFSKTDTIIDIGAEAGRFSSIHKDENSTVVSVDIDSYSLRRLKQKNKQTHIIQADARNIPLKQDIFDAILIIEVLDYIPELKQSINECYRILKQNSILVLSFGNKSSVKSKIKKIRGGSYRHSYQEVVECLFKAGFSIVRKTGYNWLRFGRTSESKGVPLISGAENILRLRSVTRYSPWVLICAVKT